VNLVALRALRGKDDEETQWVRKYRLGLSLVAATSDIDLYLREGCLLRQEGEAGQQWHVYGRHGHPEMVDLSSSKAKGTVGAFVKESAEYFRPKWPDQMVYDFDINMAKSLLAKKDDAENTKEA
jgi:CRISPR-associated protein Csb1